MTKIDIFSGFLGAGKTTLIKKLLEEGYKGEKVVLIENEFGEIGIDGGFLKEAGVEINEMNSGCICCSLVGDFAEALTKVKEQFNPDRILIEPSGVGKLSDVIKAVEQVVTDDLQISGVVTVVDAGKCKMYMKNFGEFFNNQVQYAKTILLSRTQLVSEEKVNAAIALIREQNAECELVTTNWNDLTGAQILAAMDHKMDLAKALLEEEEICPECGHHHHHGKHHHHDHEHHHHEEGEECCCGHHHDHDHEHHHHHHHADEVFTSWGGETTKKYSKTMLDAILNKLANSEDLGIVLRAKGMVANTEGTWYHFDLTPGEYEIRIGSAETIGRLCVIGSKLKEAEIKALFEI